MIPRCSFLTPMNCMVETRRDYCVNIFPSGNNFSCSFYNVQFTLNPHSPMSSAFSHPFSNLPSSACQSFLPLHPRWLLLLPFSAIISPAQPRLLALVSARWCGHLFSLEFLGSSAPKGLSCNSRFPCRSRLDVALQLQRARLLGAAATPRGGACPSYCRR